MEMVLSVLHSLLLFLKLDAWIIVHTNQKLTNLSRDISKFSWFAKL